MPLPAPILIILDLLTILDQTYLGREQGGGSPTYLAREEGYGSPTYLTGGGGLPTYLDGEEEGLVTYLGVGRGVRSPTYLAWTKVYLPTWTEGGGRVKWLMD